MYWYGWTATTIIVSTIAGFLATLLPESMTKKLPLILVWLIPMLSIPFFIWDLRPAQACPHSDSLPYGEACLTFLGKDRAPDWHHHEASRTHHFTHRHHDGYGLVRQCPDQGDCEEQVDEQPQGPKGTDGY